jgi:hypothetical protein
VIALASGFYFNQSSHGGEIELLRQPAKADDIWLRQPIAVDPVVHRLRWGDLEGSGRPVLVHAPIFGPDSHGTQAPQPAHLWAFRLPPQPDRPWEVWKIDESLTVLHGICVVDLDGDGRDEILTASFDGTLPRTTCLTFVCPLTRIARFGEMRIASRGDPELWPKPPLPRSP